MKIAQGVKILTGDHKDEPGVIVNVLENDIYNVLTLAGHIHLFKASDLRK